MILLTQKQLKGIENLENLENLRVWRSLEDIDFYEGSVVTFELNNKEYLAFTDWPGFKENLDDKFV